MGQPSPTRPGDRSIASPQKAGRSRGTRRVLEALAEALYPCVVPEALGALLAGRPDQAQLYLLSGAEDAAALQEVERLMATLPPEQRLELKLLLHALRGGLGTLLLGGVGALTRSFPFVHAFPDLPPRARERILRGWSGSPLPPLRKAFKGSTTLVLRALMSSRDKQGRNASWECNGYQDGRKHLPALEVSASKKASESMLCHALHDLHAELPPGAVPAPGGEYDAVYECDAVVVGSGAGGGVTAAVLSKAGMRVLVVEKGRYTRAGALSLQEREAFGALYERGGLLTTTDLGIGILAGASVGGGTRVNWSASLRTPPHVLREWSGQLGLEAYGSERYQRALDAVCSRLDVNTGIERHNGNNEALRVGLERLGLPWTEFPRNAPPDHHCGSCCFGCPTGEKRDVTATFLADACERGARVFSGAFAEEVLTEPLPPHLQEGSTPERTKRVVGVVVRSSPPPDIPGAAPTAGAEGPPRDAGLKGQPQGGRRILIRAKHVVCAGGALHTPALLLRSGIKGRGTVGRNLRIHPATIAAGVFPRGWHGYKEGLRLWEGAIMSVYSSAAADWEGSGYGPLLATPSVHPGLAACGFAWLGGADFKRLLLSYPDIAAVLVYARDNTTSGRITIGRDGLPRVHYFPNKHDQRSLLKGLELGLRAMQAAGAEMVSSLQPGLKFRFTVTPPAPGAEVALSPPGFEEYLAGVHKEGVRVNRMGLFSAHQMGSCRMGASPQASVLDPRGECWQVAGLYAADASALPTSTGVNPMITVEATAHMIAEGLAEAWAAQARGGGAEQQGRGDPLGAKGPWSK